MTARKPDTPAASEDAPPAQHKHGEVFQASKLREQHLERLRSDAHDVLVVGGGVNGAVSALALASHGLRVALIDMGDFASGVSQESSNLIWGGFKYLQSYEVGLVAGLCRSRNLLARSYSSRISEVRFLAALGPTSPYSPAYAAMGANAYWALGRFATRRPRLLSSDSLAEAEPAIESGDVRGAVEYSDFLLCDNDARFVLQLLLDAVDKGATAVSRMRLENAERGAAGWRARLVDGVSGDRHDVSARLLVNAAGPRAVQLAAVTGASLSRQLCFSKGAHIVVPQVTDSGRVLAFFDDDRRLFYVIPMGHRSVIGTTDTRVSDAAPPATDEDLEFLLEQAGARLRLSRPLDRGDVIAHRCGVRALVVDENTDTDRDWTELSRRHSVEVDQARGAVSILGGKLSDCLNVGDEVVAASQRCGLRPRPPKGLWFGEPHRSVKERFQRSAARAGIGQAATASLWRRHGSRAQQVADLVAESPRLGEALSARVDYCAAELMVMARHEHILTMDDFLRRRTMLAMLEPAEALSDDPGVQQAAELLFGAAA